MTESNDENEVDESSELERHLSANLEETWQEESPTTATVTDFADEVDGELGTRPSTAP